jgi:hypothetical protein
VVRRLVDEHVILAGEQPRQRAGRELVAALAEQVRGAAAHDEVELQLGVPVGTWRAVGRCVAFHAPRDARPQTEVLAHRKKRSEPLNRREGCGHG